MFDIANMDFLTLFNISLLTYPALVFIAFIITRPNKKVFRLVVLAGVICSLIDFVIEASALALDIWDIGTVNTPLTPLGVPIIAILCFVLTGMFISMFSDLPEVAGKRFKSASRALKGRNSTLARIFIVSIASLFFMIYDISAYLAGYWIKASWWSFSYTYLVWLFILGSTVMIYRLLLKKYSQPTGM
jgi:hypothetical protein